MVHFRNLHYFCKLHESLHGPVHFPSYIYIQFINLTVCAKCTHVIRKSNMQDRGRSRLLQR